MTRAWVWSKVLPALGALALTGCPEESGTQQVVEEVPDAHSVSTRDGRLAMTMPVDLMVHSHDDALFGTSLDGGFRLFVSHQPPDKIMRAVGNAKEILIKRDWELVEELHFERAAVIRFEIKESPAADPTELRTVWFVERPEGIITCDGVATPEGARRLGDDLKELCQSVRVERPEAAPTADAATGGAVSPGATGDAGPRP